MSYLNNGIMVYESAYEILDELNEMTDVDYYIENYFLEETTTNYFLEYSGSKSTNEEFIKCLDDTDKMLKAFKEDIKLTFNTVDGINTIANKLKKNNAESVYKEISELTKKSNDKTKELYKDINIKQIAARFERAIKKFDNKYSAPAMDARVKLARKIEKYLEELVEMYDKYCTEKYVNNINKIYVKCQELNLSFADKYIRVVGSWFNYAAENCKTTMADIRYVIRKLDVSAKDFNLLFKILNKDYSSQLKNVAKKIGK